MSKISKNQPIPWEDETITRNEVLAMIAGVADYMNGNYIELNELEKRLDGVSARTRREKFAPRAKARTRSRAR